MAKKIAAALFFTILLLAGPAALASDYPDAIMAGDQQAFFIGQITLANKTVAPSITAQDALPSAEAAASAPADRGWQPYWSLIAVIVIGGVAGATAGVRGCRRIARAKADKNVSLHRRK